MEQLRELFARYDRLVIFDTETTGLDFSRDEIIEFAAVVVEQRSGKAGFRSQFRRRFREVEAPSALYSHPHARRYC